MDLYDELGVQKLINAVGTYTVIGAVRMTDRTLARMCEASRWNVKVEDLKNALEARIARMTHNEDAFICNSCSTALYIAAAAFAERHLGKPFDRITGDELARCEAVALWGQHIPYDHAIEQLGVRLRFIGYPNVEAAMDEAVLENAIGPDTVFCYFAPRTPDGYYGEGCMNLETMIRIAHRRGVPVLADAAAQLPPKSNLWRFTEMGADIACFSGGKDLAGPQASGLTVGSREIIGRMRRLGFPNYGPGRLMKIGREEMVALYTAIEAYMEADEDARLRSCEEQVALLVRMLEDCAHLRAERTWPNQAGQPLPRAFVRITDGALSAAQLREKLMEGNPGIFCYSENRDGVYINPMCLGDGEMEFIARRFREIDAELGNGGL